MAKGSTGQRAGTVGENRESSPDFRAAIEKRGKTHLTQTQLASSWGSEGQRLENRFRLFNRVATIDDIQCSCAQKNMLKYPECATVGSQLLSRFKELGLA